MSASVISVSRKAEHEFSKPPCDVIRLIEGLGVEGDAHLGKTVQHLSRIARDPTVLNVRQVHLIPAELHDELNASGFNVAAGDLGENITTRGIDLIKLPKGTRLHIGEAAVVEVTGLRNPCHQIDNFQKGLLKACLGRDADGNLIRKTGVMSVIVSGGEVRAGDAIRVVLPAEPHQPLEVV